MDTNNVFDTLTATGEPVSEQAPGLAPSTTPTEAPTPATLPADYLANGYYAITDSGAKYLRPAYVGSYAEQIAAALSTMKQSDFTALLREMKHNKKRTLPFEARQTAAYELLPKALSLVHHKKASPILVDFVRKNLDAISTDEDWSAFYRHMDAINGYLSVEKEADI
jgi:hypothetical protein